MAYVSGLGKKKIYFAFFFSQFVTMSQQEDLSHSLQELSLKKEEPVIKKTTASYDKVALRERWNILGKDAEQSKLRHTYRNMAGVKTKKKILKVTIKVYYQ